MRTLFERRRGLRGGGLSQAERTARSWLEKKMQLLRIQNDNHHADCLLRQLTMTSIQDDDAVSASLSGSSGTGSQRLSRATKDIAFGSLAGMVSKVFEHPFDLVKVRLQTQPSDRPAMFTGALDCFRQTYVKEGVRGLYRGLSMPVLGATLENATLFFTYNFVQGKLRSLAGYADQGSSSTSSLQQDAEKPLGMGYVALAAASAGATASFVLTPVELIKCKMQVQMVTRELEVLSAESKVVRSTGATSAVSTASFKAPSSASGSHVLARGAASVGGGAGVRQLSSQAFATLDGPLTIFQKVLKHDGVRGLWLGQTGTLLRESGGGMAWFLTFEWASRLMLAAKQKTSSVQVTKKDLSSAQLIVAGAMSGVAYNVILFPADSVKSTMQTEREWALSQRQTSANAVAESQVAFKGRGFIATLRQIWQTRGIRGLYAGCGVTCMRSAPSSALIFFMYNRLEVLADEYGL